MVCLFRTNTPSWRLDPGHVAPGSPSPSSYVGWSNEGWAWPSSHATYLLSTEVWRVSPMSKFYSFFSDLRCRHDHDITILVSLFYHMFMCAVLEWPVVPMCDTVFFSWPLCPCVTPSPPCELVVYFCCWSSFRRTFVLIETCPWSACQPIVVLFFVMFFNCVLGNFFFFSNLLRHSLSPLLFEMSHWRELPVYPFQAKDLPTITIVVSRIESHTWY